MFDLSPDTSYGTTYHDPSRSYTPPRASSSSHLAAHTTPSTPHKNFFSYRSPHLSNPTPSRTPKDRHGPNLNPRSELYSLSPVKLSSQQMLLSPRKTPRQVPKIPYKVLDAPDLADDFYLNLVDWGQSNSLAVGLGKAVYMWNSQSGRVVKLCELPGDDSVTSVNWIQRGSHLAIGTHKGTVQIWDANYQRRLRTMTGHTARVGALAWNEHILTSGSRDRLIYHRDVRAPDQFLTRLIGHKQEVCGLKWNTQDGQLASGGNDNKLLVWDKLNSTPLHKFAEHSAAVKAIAWSPHQRGLLASGGGTADRKLRFWNTIVPQNNSYHQNNMFSSVNNSNNNNHFNPSPSPSTNDASSSSTNPHLLQTLDTGSQICNLLFSKTSNELVSTHGYSQNQIVVWKYPSLQQVVSLTGHTYRVLYLAMSPDGRVIVTGAGDETLRFWKLFGADNPGPKKGGGSRIGSLDRLGAVIR